MQKSLGQIVVPSHSPAAIPIVAPSDGPNSPTPKPVSKPLKGINVPKRQCRNVIIHGFCKYEDKGCEFNHDGNKPPQEIPENKPKLRVQSPSTRPTTMVSTVSADSVNAPVFVPKFSLEAPLPPVSTTVESTPNEEIETEPLTSPEQEYNHPMPSLTREFSNFSLGNDSPTAQALPQTPSQMLNSMVMMQPEQTDQYYYMNSAVYQRQPLQYHLYSAPPTRMPKLAANQKTIQSFFMPDDLREQLTERNEKVLTIGSTHDQSLPQEVHIYHSLSLLDDTSSNGGKFFGHTSWVYKSVCSVDGRSYVLVRIADCRLANELAMSMVENWKRIRHCNVVAIRDAFSTSAFDDSSLVFVYDYHPCSETLQHTHLSSQTQTNFQRQSQIKASSSPHVPESTLWSYITQIASALKSIHALGLAARVMDPTKILVTGKNRIRLNCVCIADVLQFDGGQSLSRHQQEDLLAFGKIIVALACNSTHSIQNLSQSFEYISRFYSPDLKNTILYLLSKPMPTKTVDEVVSLIGPHILQEINGNHSYNDTLENELSRELENARLVRIMSKMAFINERPVFDMDPSWSETGDRYIIKLFRDYVFHQVDAKGTPVVDMVHAITCLNKLDAGVDEKIMLMSRDEQSCLVVSYKEVKNCIINSFNDLTSGRK